MSGVAMIVLTDHDLQALETWYFAHYLAGENSGADDALVAKIKSTRLTIACQIAGTCSVGV